MDTKLKIGDIVDVIGEWQDSGERLQFGTLVQIKTSGNYTLHIVDWGNHNEHLVSGDVYHVGEELVSTAFFDVVDVLTKI